VFSEGAHELYEKEANPGASSQVRADLAFTPMAKPVGFHNETCVGFLVGQ
jgi:hypothetical protein